MADHERPAEFVAAEAWRILVTTPKTRAERKRNDTSPPCPKPAEKGDAPDFWAAAWDTDDA